MPPEASNARGNNSYSAGTGKQASSGRRPSEAMVNSVDQDEKLKTRNVGEAQVESKDTMREVVNESTENKNIDSEGRTSEEEQNELKAAEKGALDAMVRFKMMHSALQEKGKIDMVDEEVKRKKPIQLKDAAGRKYSFPFHLCLTWQVSF